MATTKTGLLCDTENEFNSYSVITSLLFTTLVLSYIPQRVFLFIRRPYAKFLPLWAFIAYIAGTFASIHLMQAVCGKNNSFGDEKPLQGLGRSIARLIQMLRVGLQWFGLTSLFPIYFIALYYAVTCSKKHLEPVLLPQNVSNDLEGNIPEPLPPRVGTVVLTTSIHTFVIIVWSSIFAVWPTENNFDLVMFSAWACFIALVSTFMAIVPRYPNHYSLFTLKIAERWITPVLCVQASMYFILAGSLAARFGVHHALSPNRICSRGQSIWINFLFAGFIHSMSIYMLYLIPKEGRDAIDKAEAENLAAEQAKDGIRKSTEDTAMTFTIDDHTPLISNEESKTH